jgi:type IV secretory pathway VirB2 component (pilin)
MSKRDLVRSCARSLPSLVACLAWMVLPDLAFAQAASPFQTGANSLVTNAIAIATPFAVLAIMVLAVVAMSGRISWGWPVGAVVGICVLFGAQQIVTWARGLFGV